jgi:cyanophycin synthetase
MTILTKIGAGLRHLNPLKDVLLHRRDLELRKRFRDARRPYYRNFWHQVCEREGWQCEDLGQSCQRIRDGGRSAYTYGYYVQLDSPALLSIAADKILSRMLLEEIGVPVPRQLPFELSRLSAARNFMRSLGTPVVVKPADGGGGNGVTTDIVDSRGLGRAAIRAASVNANILVEEQIQGDNYRLLYLDGELIDAIRRDRPSVVGDGKHSVSKLIDRENMARLDEASVSALSPLLWDSSVANYLKKLGLTARHVPPQGEVFRVKTSINQNAARDNHRVTDQVHPYYHDLGRRITKHVNIRLLGVDLITPSIEHSPEEAGGAINELNGTPAFHHHELVTGQRELSFVGPAVIRLILAGCEVTTRIATTVSDPLAL